MGSGVTVRWVPHGKLAPVSEPPGAAPAGLLTCLLPVSPATFCPFSGHLCRPSSSLPAAKILYFGFSCPSAFLFPWGSLCDLPFSFPSFLGQARGGGAEKQGAEGRGLQVKPRGQRSFQNSRTAPGAPQFPRQPRPPSAALPALGFGGRGVARGVSSAFGVCTCKELTSEAILFVSGEQ